MNKPNIVYILSDDLGYGDVSCLNTTAKIRTPRMDQLAAEGIIFSDAHSSSAVCTPTRYSVLTGEYCWRSRLKKSVLWGYSPPLIERGKPTVASILAAENYRTACIGKWHLGLDWAWPDGMLPNDDPITEDPGIDYSEPLKHGPNSVGFHESYILPASLDMPPYCYVHNGRVTAPPVAAIEGSQRPPFWREGACSPGFEHETCLLELTRRAEAFIDHQALSEPDRPFFLYFATPSPHTPHSPRSPFKGSSEAGAYGDLVVEHDWSIGCILDALERNGLTRNTLVIVTSDNGAHIKGEGFDFVSQYGHHGNHIYRGQKSDCWDGGHRVPFIVRWPEVVAPGRTCSAPICLTDFLMTVAEICSVSLPANTGADGVGLLSLLKGQESDAVANRSIVHHSINGDFSLRAGPWKLVVCRGSGGWSMEEYDAPDDAPDLQLYHLGHDPEESFNLIVEEPEVAARLLENLTAICGNKYPSSA